MSGDQDRKISFHTFKKYFFVSHYKLKDSWWHRLHFVLLISSLFIPLLFALSVIVVTLDYYVETKRIYTKYSFEDGFLSEAGKIEDCRFYSYSFSCGEYESSTQLLNDYGRPSGKYDLISSLRDSGEASDDEILHFLSNRDDFDMSVRYKNIYFLENYHYIVLAFLSLPVFILIWILFWESVIYRSIIYIAFGKNV